MRDDTGTMWANVLAVVSVATTVGVLFLPLVFG
jgi:hypothetical protein